MFAPLIAKAKSDSGRVTTSAPQRSTLLKHHVSGDAHGLVPRRIIGNQAELRELARSPDPARLKPTSGTTRDFSKIPLFLSDRASRSLFPLTTVPSAPVTCSNIRPLDAYSSASGVDSATCDEDTPVPEEPESLEPCGDNTHSDCAEKKGIRAEGTQPASACKGLRASILAGGGRRLALNAQALAAGDDGAFAEGQSIGISAHGQSKLNVSSPADQSEQQADRVAKNECIPSEGGQCSCPTCAEGALQAQDAYTYTFNSRGSYGQTDPGFSRPSCAASAAGASTIVAGSAAPTITVFPTGTYQVTRNDGAVKTATCTRLAAGLAATRAHENSHAAGARAAVAAANTAQGLPMNYATAALCTTALPAILTAWNTSVDAAWTNEVTHGPGTNPPTAQTFAQENAAGNCTFT